MSLVGPVYDGPPRPLFNRLPQKNFMKCRDCDRVYEPKQEWIHVPCRYMAGLEGRPELAVNHVKPEQRGRVTGGVTPKVLSVTEIASRVTEATNEVEVVTRTAHALRQERYREQQKAKT